jgi:hypothetical protein
MRASKCLKWFQDFQIPFATKYLKCQDDLRGAVALQYGALFQRYTPENPLDCEGVLKKLECIKR